MIAYKKGTYMCFTTDVSLETLIKDTPVYANFGIQRLIIGNKEALFNQILATGNYSLVCNAEWAQSHNCATQLCEGQGSNGVLVITEDYAGYAFGTAIQTVLGLSQANPNSYYFAATQKVYDDLAAGEQRPSINVYGYNIADAHPLNNYGHSLASMMNCKPTKLFNLADGSSIATFELSSGDGDRALPFAQAKTVVVKDGRLIAIGGIKDVANAYLSIPDSRYRTKNLAETLACRLRIDGGISSWNMAEETMKYNSAHHVDIDPDDLFCYLPDFDSTMLAQVIRQAKSLNPLEISAYTSGFRWVNQKGAMQSSTPLAAVVNASTLPEEFQHLVIGRLINHEGLRSQESIKGIFDLYDYSSLLVLESALVNILNEFLPYYNNYLQTLRKAAAKRIQSLSKKYRVKLLSAKADEWINDWLNNTSYASHRTELEKLIQQSYVEIPAVKGTRIEGTGENAHEVEYEVQPARREPIPKMSFHLHNPEFYALLDTTEWLNYGAYGDELSDEQVNKCLAGAFNFMNLDGYPVANGSFTAETLERFAAEVVLGYEDVSFCVAKYSTQASDANDPLVYWCGAFGVYTKTEPAEGVSVYGPNGVIGELISQVQKEGDNYVTTFNGLEMTFTKGYLVSMERDVLSAGKAQFEKKLNLMMDVITKRVKKFYDFALAPQSQLIANMNENDTVAPVIKGSNSKWWAWADLNNHSGHTRLENKDGKRRYHRYSGGRNSKAIVPMYVQIHFEKSHVYVNLGVAYKFFNKAWMKDYESEPDIKNHLKWIWRGCPASSGAGAQGASFDNPFNPGIPAPYSEDLGDNSYLNYDESWLGRNMPEPEYQSADQFFEEQQKGWATLAGVLSSMAAITAGLLLGPVGWIVGGVAVLGLIIAALWPWQDGDLATGYSVIRIADNGDHMAARENPLYGPQPATIQAILTPDGKNAVEYTLEKRAASAAILEYMPLLLSVVGNDPVTHLSPTIMCQVNADFLSLKIAYTLGVMRVDEFSALIEACDALLNQTSVSLPVEMQAAIRRIKSQFTEVTDAPPGVIPIVTEEALTSASILDEFSAFDVACSYIGLN